MAALLVQVDDDDHEKLVYYLSRIMNDAKKNYSSVEKTCLVLLFTAQKLHHYLLTHDVYLVIHDNLVRHLHKQPALSGCAAQWLLKFMEFDIKCITQRLSKVKPLQKSWQI